MFGWDLENGKVTINGKGDALVSFTARTDLARFVAHVLTALPAERLANRVFRIEGERTVSLPFIPSSHAIFAHEMFLLQL